MNINPAVTAYSNLNITDAELEDMPKKSSMGTGLLSRNRGAEPKEKSNEPMDRVKDYVASIRKKRKQLTNGR
tara:strand:+ start:197 stop:412 length:216 start_codon:yes stop_codon:yes gene_type:complete